MGLLNLKSNQTIVLRNKSRRDSMLADENVLAELADGTGGTFFHNNNNLQEGLSSLISGPEHSYLLAFSAAKVKPSGRYHELKVMVREKGYKVQTRRGYYVSPQGTKNK